MPILCADPDCERTARTRGMCQMHYIRWVRSFKPKRPVIDREKRNTRIEELRRRRTALGLTSKRLGNLMACSRTTVCHAEGLSYRVGDAFLDRYEAALKTHIAAVNDLARKWGYL